MDIGTVLIIALAFIFFGGIGLISYKNRRRPSSNSETLSLKKMNVLSPP